MLDYIKNKIKEKFDMKTYSIGLLQAQVYRTLKIETNEILKDYKNAKISIRNEDLIICKSTIVPTFGSANS